MTDTGSPEASADRNRLTVSLHEAQAQGVFRDPTAVNDLLLGIAGALIHTVEGNYSDPETAWALQSDVYWDHFEMDIKEALLGAFAGLDPSLCSAVRRVVDATLSTLKRSHHCS